MLAGCMHLPLILLQHVSCGLLLSSVYYTSAAISNLILAPCCVLRAGGGDWLTPPFGAGGWDALPTHQHTVVPCAHAVLCVLRAGGEWLIPPRWLWWVLLLC
jgi:hypothetical protein